MPGSILGTAAYMAPEQAKGLNADPRSDLFSFGCILFEMLTGKRAFDGETASEVLASVIKTEPNLDLLPANTNAGIRKLLQRCLEKNPKNRWHAAADVRLEIQSLATAEDVRSTPVRSSWPRFAVVILALAVGGTLGAIAVWKSRPASLPPAVVRLSVIVPESQLLNLTYRPFAISPDGTQVVYFAKGQCYLRSISESEGKPIAGTEDSIASTNPAFSPDGKSIAFYAVSTRNIKKISINGGVAVTLASVGRLGLGGMEWTEDGIVFGSGYSEIVKISENGGEPESLVKAQGSERIGMPHMLPGGKALLFSIFDAARGRQQIAVQVLNSPQRKILMDQDLTYAALPDARYLPTGHIVYVHAGTLFAAPFDVKRLEIGPVSVAVIQGIRVSTALEPLLSISESGSLIYMPGPTSTSNLFTLAFADREGVLEGLKLQPGPYQTPRISLDGKRIVFGLEDGKDADIWVYDLSRKGSPSRLTFGGKNRFPVWSPNGDRIAFQSDREGDLGIFVQRADGNGTAERLTTPEKGAAHIPESWGPVGDTLLFRALKSATAPIGTLWTLSIQGKKLSPFGGVESDNPTAAVFSPDGHWVAYNTYLPDKYIDEIYVQPFPATGAKYQLPIPRDNHHAAWSRDGKELLYIPGPGEFAAIGVTTTPSFAFGNPMPIKQILQTYAPGSPRQYDVAPDGRLLGELPADQSITNGPLTSQIQVVLNWFTELRERAPLNNASTNEKH
jgi:serine/threonine-protein kinase